MTTIDSHDYHIFSVTVHFLWAFICVVFSRLEQSTLRCVSVQQTLPVFWFNYYYGSPAAWSFKCSIRWTNRSLSLGIKTCIDADYFITIKHAWLGCVWVVVGTDWRRRRVQWLVVSQAFNGGNISVPLFLVSESADLPRILKIHLPLQSVPLRKAL